MFQRFNPIGRLQSAGRFFSSLSGLPKQVRIVEVGPRDGLQAEKLFIPTPIKIELINRLSATGLTTIEAGSFVSPKSIPQLADSKEVLEQITRYKHISYPVLVPNQKGLENALKVRVGEEAIVKEVAIFTTPSQEFSKKNKNRSVEQDDKELSEVVAEALKHNLRVRAYVSCVLGCPYEGEMDPVKVLKQVCFYLDQGCYEVSLGDTIGIGTPESTKRLLDVLLTKISPSKLAVHFHDTHRRALQNIGVALTAGIQVIDSSVGGLGGCPYAKNATGNVATEEVLRMMEQLKIHTGVSLVGIEETSRFIKSHMHKTVQPGVNS